MDKEHFAHHGVLGMKWGVRRYQNSNGTLTSAGKKRYGGNGGEKENMDPERRERIKKAAVAAGAALAVAAGTALYIRNKSAVDNFVSRRGNQLLSSLKKTNELAASGRKAASAQALKAVRRRAKDYSEAHKDEILKSPSKLSRYKDYLTPEEVSSGIKDLQQTQALRNLRHDRIQRGAKYIQDFLAYGTAVTSIYGLSKSALAQDIKKKASQKTPEKKSTNTG